MKSLRSFMFPAMAALGVALALGIFVPRGFAAESLWQTDFKAAQAKAKKEKKYLLVDFTGSDWCGWCIRLRNEVFDKESFKTEAPKQFILVELDFPRQKELSEDLKKQNDELGEKYKVQGYPTVLMIDAEGEVIARTGYREGGPDEYLKHLAEFSKIYEGILVLKAKLEKTKGLDRAKLLDQIVESSQKLGNESDEVKAWSKEIIALDPDNKAGLKVKYEFPLALAETVQLLRSGKTDQARAVVDKALALKGVPAEMRQNGYMLKAQLCLSGKKFADAVAVLKLAKEAAPESRAVKRIDSFIRQFGKVAEAQEAADKLEAGLAKAKGAERAKLLDKLIDAKQKLIPFDREAGENVKKWSKEIISLDPDNKAGLKKKHELKAAMADVLELAQAGKADEAIAALDKALETGGDSGDEVQQAQLLKAQLGFMQQHDQEQYVAQLKKALEAAPEGELAPRIKMMLRQAEQRAPKPAAKKPKDE